MANDAHDERGRFAEKGTTGSAVGDHQRSQSKPVGPGRQPVQSAKAERIAMRKQVDERHYPTESNASVASKTDLARPMGSVTATGGRFSAKGTTLDPKRNDHLNAMLRASASPTPRTQPGAGQMVAAGIITKQ